MALYQTIQQPFDPMAQLNIDYQLFLREYAGGVPLATPGPPLTNPVQPLVPTLVQPTGYLAPAPEEPPYRPAVILDQEHLMHRGEGVAITIICVIALIVRGWVLISTIVGLVVYAIWKYIQFRENVVKYYETEKLRLQGRVLPAPQPQPHYVINAM